MAYSDCFSEQCNPQLAPQPEEELRFSRFLMDFVSGTVFNEALECKVQERTAELRNTNEQLCREIGEIRAALEREKELGDRGACFASMMSEEFRTPLNIILFSTSLLRRHSHKWTEEKKRPHLDRIQTAVKQLSQLLDGVLLIDEAEAGKLTFEPRALDLEQFCRKLLAEIHLSHSSQQHTLTFESFGNCRAAYVDEGLLQPILTNLLDNAIKYSPTCSAVHLELYCRDGKVIFQIKDRGIGIPAAERQRLFKPFHRGKNVGDIPGNGLGLAVVKKLVDIHGGSISVESEVGVGTTFTVMLPLGMP